MKRSFIIGIDSTSKEQAKSIEDWLKESGAGWWHWIDGMWLVVSHDSNMTVTSIREKLKTLAPGVTHLVIAVERITWAGYGPNSDERNMFTWLRNNWDT